ncbi:MAG: glycolate oxidase subunit GlcE [Gammaproteobacteria bacterium]|nr:glycolate oxidase subunit GlcE [Gammaproteobacteria bacterium]NIR84958.1 glycolate oxidase subunit GlcE [Gammaproteobacteria bacterium]NIR91807.1 glycolate oxidase subunit GlcE [Gammaproteobacteria bacterium]NIU06005.1 glycolate oxidase subunit GlcE [Gammaproteobacteria bacterium]NIV53052.1 glycolate oxidase subunit GlcE [Gammaproteobacteria bacterium]
MSTEQDISAELQEQVKAAAAEGTPVRIVGGGTKTFYGREPRGTPLEVSGHRGIVAYEPSELVITARAGTPLSEVESTLAERGQMLAFEPPHFGAGATLGGAMATGLSGPRRPYAGAARDMTLGVKILNGKGDILRFGGQVMKNVAGYDISRLMVGAVGTLGVLLEITLKLLPAPAAETTRVFELDAASAIRTMNTWAATPAPISAACHDGAHLYLRLAGTGGGVASAVRKLGGESLDEPGFWSAVREHTHEFFAADEPLWRLAVPPASPPLPVAGRWFTDWGGAQRWLRTEAETDEVRARAMEAHGHASVFRGGERAGEVFHPLAAEMLRLHQSLKVAFDPERILNPGRMYAEL